MGIIGIYKIENKINHKVYVGQTTDFESRIRKHKNQLEKNEHKNSYLQNAWNKYGKDNFMFELIEQCAEDCLTEREQYWIDYYGSILSNNTYNLKEAGNSGKFTEEIRCKIGEANRHRVYKRGFHLSEETKKKISDALSGRECPNKGYHHTEKTKKLIGEASKNRPRRRWTDAEKQAQSKRLKGKSAPNKGKLMNNSHKICQYSLDDKLLKIWPSTHVLLIETGYNPGCVSKCCRGNMKTAYGYKWKYLD